MKLSTVTLPSIEMTRAEENELWEKGYWERKVDGKQVQQWNTSDGNNEIQLEGEEFYRLVVITDR